MRLITQMMGRGEMAETLYDANTTPIKIISCFKTSKTKRDKTEEKEKKITRGRS